MKTYNGQLIEQNRRTAPKFFAFSANASEVLEWAGIVTDHFKMHHL